VVAATLLAAIVLTLLVGVTAAAPADQGRESCMVTSVKTIQVYWYGAWVPRTQVNIKITSADGEETGYSSLSLAPGLQYYLEKTVVIFVPTNYWKRWWGGQRTEYRWIGVRPDLAQCN